MPKSEKRHPALMNAIYLWACYLSRPGTLSQYEPLYLSRATTALGDSAQFCKTVDIIQVSCLLTLYSFTKGRQHRQRQHPHPYSHPRTTPCVSQAHPYVHRALPQATCSCVSLIWS